jgi:hypothetical protein
MIFEILVPTLKIIESLTTSGKAQAGSGLRFVRFSRLVSARFFKRDFGGVEP